MINFQNFTEQIIKLTQDDTLYFHFKKDKTSEPM